MPNKPPEQPTLFPGAGDKGTGAYGQRRKGDYSHVRCPVCGVPNADHTAECSQHPYLPKRPRVVCLCGSTKFKQEFIEANYRETMAGRIVLSVGWFSHADAAVYTPTEAEKVALDELHKRKIDLADEVFVCNVGGYIGDSTRSEIAYAVAAGKPVRYLEPLAPEARPR